MADYKLRKGLKIGAMEAENDKILGQVFVDLGYLDELLETTDSCSLIVGRTGSGKSALLRMIREQAEHFVDLNPNNLCMQYLYNSTILRVLSDWEITLEPYYQFLWRHVCILELIRLRYSDIEDVPSRLQRIMRDFNILDKESRKSRDAKEIAQKYLKDHGEEYWIRTDTHIKNITSEMETTLNKDESISTEIKACIGKASPSVTNKRGTKDSQKISEEIKRRAQDIVSSHQISDLNKVIDLMAEVGFSDPQKKYYILIDNLDDNWMPDDMVYLSLIKSLLKAGSYLNQRIKNVKIVIAIRENIFHRVFRWSGRHDPQREKLVDVICQVQWSRHDLLTMVDRRLSETFRLPYTTGSLHLKDILPVKRSRDEENAVDYLIERTFMRPRDIIKFINLCMNETSSGTRFVWQDLHRAEEKYSSDRLSAVIDEWKDGYGGLTATYEMLRECGPWFQFSDFTDEMLYNIVTSVPKKDDFWLKQLQELAMTPNVVTIEVKLEVIEALYLVGMIGIRSPGCTSVNFSFDQSFYMTESNLRNCTIHVHKMFWSALGITPRSRGDMQVSSVS